LVAMIVNASKQFWRILSTGAALTVAACGAGSAPPADPRPTLVTQGEYRIEPLDTVQVFVWRSPELSATVPVRPDGRISLPLIPDIMAAGRTSEQLADDVAGHLNAYIRDPVVTVMLNHFGSPYEQQVRVLGEVMRPVAVPYRPNMSVLDLVIDGGGLTQFAAGNRAVLVRNVDGKRASYMLRLNDLVNNADISANADVMPGDTIIVPRSWF
jgi:polysaccharide biosynthesis/export protein